MRTDPSGRSVDAYLFSGSSVYTIEQVMEAVQLSSDWYRKSG